MSEVKKIPAKDSAGLVDRAVLWKGERLARLASDEQWHGMPTLEEMSTNGTPQSAS